MASSYFLKRPAGRRKSYALIGPNGKTVKDPRMAAINDGLRRGLPMHKAERLAQQVLASWQEGRKKAPELAADNEHLLEDYWASEGGRRKARDKDEAKAYLRRGIEALGLISIRSAPIARIQEALDALPPNIQRRRAAAVNTLLRWAKRPERVYLEPLPEQEPIYMTLEELKAILPHLPSDEHRLLCQAALGTGARQGELFGLTPFALKTSRGGVFYAVITSQITRKNKHGRRKAGKLAQPIIVTELADAVRKWAAVPPSTKATIRSAELARIVQRACKAANIRKHLTFHNFRHSYVWYWTQRGLSLDAVAKCLGDSIVTVEKFYRRWAAEDAWIDSLAPLLRQGQG